jgi:hypothetical protein
MRVPFLAIFAPRWGEIFEGAMSALQRLAPVHEIGQHAFDQYINAAIRRGLANDRNPVKTLAAAGDVNIGTSKNWWEGRNTPQSFQLLKLMARIPELAAEVRRLTAMETDIHPEFERDLAQAFATFQRLTGGGK